MKKTELEKRWEEETEESDHEEVEESKFIDSSFTDKDHLAPIALVSSGDKVYIGGVLEIDGNGCVLDHPMLYLEIPEKDQATGRFSLQIGIQKVYSGLSIPNNMLVRHDTFNMLRANSPSNMKLVKLYESSVKRVLASDAGIVIPEESEMEFLKTHG